MQRNASSITVPRKVFNQLMNLFGEFKYNEIASLLNELNRVTTVTDSAAESDLSVISKICITIADNVVYSKCAPVLITMENVIRLHKDKVKAEAEKQEVTPEATEDNSSEGNPTPE